MTPLDQFLRCCSDEIGRRASLQEHRRPILEAGATAFSEAVDAASPRPHDLASVPVTGCLDELSAGPLVSALLAARHELSWVSSSRTSDEGVECALAPLNEVRNLDNVTCGLMLISPGCVYPEHAHPPNEIYLPISGEGRWRYGGDSSYRNLGEDALVYNPPRALHATRAGGDPLIALYVLWS